MSAYRKPGEVAPLVLEQRGPRADCPMCGTRRKWAINGDELAPYSSNDFVERGADLGRACSGASWLVRLFGGCARRDPHIHQRCVTCNATWTAAPLEDASFRGDALASRK